MTLRLSVLLVDLWLDCVYLVFVDAGCFIALFGNAGILQHEARSLVGCCSF